MLKWLRFVKKIVFVIVIIIAFFNIQNNHLCKNGSGLWFGRGGLRHHPHNHQHHHHNHQNHHHNHCHHHCHHVKMSQVCGLGEGDCDTDADCGQGFSRNQYKK